MVMMIILKIITIFCNIYHDDRNDIENDKYVDDDNNDDHDDNDDNDARPLSS